MNRNFNRSPTPPDLYTAIGAWCHNLWLRLFTNPTTKSIVHGLEQDGCVRDSSRRRTISAIRIPVRFEFRNSFESVRRPLHPTLGRSVVSWNGFLSCYVRL